MHGGRSKHRILMRDRKQAGDLDLFRELLPFTATSSPSNGLSNPGWGLLTPLTGSPLLPHPQRLAERIQSWQEWMRPL